ncbi:MAG: hypothetical protein R3E39_02255 [Anaerolineae bacterium]
MRDFQNRFLTPTVVTGCALMIVAFITFQPVVNFLVHEQVDYANHLSYLQVDMDAEAVDQVLSMFPHFMYHLSVYTVYKVFSLDSIASAALAVSVFAYLFGTGVSYWLVIRMLGNPRSWRRAVFYGFISLTLMLLMPIDIVTPDNLLLGYIGMSVYHNPTIVLLKPFAVVLFWCAGTVFQKTGSLAGTPNRPIALWINILATLCCVMAKSSYVIALLPALVVMAGYRLARKQWVDWKNLSYGILLPACLGLGLQLVLFQNSQGFMFAPLVVISSWARINPGAPIGIVEKFLLSIAFPFLVYVTSFRAAIKDTFLNFAWITFAFGAAYMYLLAERGDRLSHANFMWSAICTLFILFVVSAIFLIRRIQDAYAARPANYRPVLEPMNIRIVVLGLVFVLHLISGVYWYYIHLTARTMGDIISTKW